MNSRCGSLLGAVACCSRFLLTLRSADDVIAFEGSLDTVFVTASEAMYDEIYDSADISFSTDGTRNARTVDSACTRTLTRPHSRTHGQADGERAHTSTKTRAHSSLPIKLGVLCDDPHPKPASPYQQRLCLPFLLTFARTCLINARRCYYRRVQ